MAAHFPALLHDVEVLDVHVFGAGHLAAFFLGVADVGEDFVGDAFAGGEDGDAGRVAHDEFAADAAGGLFDGQGFFFGVEGFLRAVDDFGLDVFGFEHFRGVLAVVAADLGEGGDEAFDVLGAVADGDVCEEVGDVAEFGLDVVFVAQEVVDFDAGEADGAREDGEFRDVEVVDGVAVHEFLAIGVVVADGVDLVARVFDEADDFVENLAAVQREVAAADVEAGHEKVGAARRLRDVDDLVDIAGIDARPA